MSKINVCIVGAGGRVGKELLHLISKNEKWVPAVGIGRGVTGFEENLTDFTKVTKKIDIVIDFSSPELMTAAMLFCKARKIPFVSGTTGLIEDQFKLLEDLKTDVPVLWSPNMSIGVALVKKCYNAFAVLKDFENDEFDFVMEEWHHKNKKDSPSGTALMLVKHFEKMTHKKIKSTESFRAGGIFGVHKLHAVSDQEHITIEHTALNRAVFAKGSLTAAKWLLDQKAGIYTIDDVLKME